MSTIVEVENEEGEKFLWNKEAELAGQKKERINGEITIEFIKCSDLEDLDAPRVMSPHHQVENADAIIELTQELKDFDVEELEADEILYEHQVNGVIEDLECLGERFDVEGASELAEEIKDFCDEHEELVGEI